jgi:hypothetical protein
VFIDFLNCQVIERASSYYLSQKYILMTLVASMVNSVDKFRSCKPMLGLGTYSCQGNIQLRNIEDMCCGFV